MILSKIYPKIFIGFTCIFLIVLYNLLYTTQRVQCITPQSSAYTVLMQRPSVTEKVTMVLQTHDLNTVFFGDFYLLGDATRPDSENGSLCLPYLIVESNPVYTAGTTSWKFYLDVLQFSNSGRILLPNELELSLVPDANTTLGLVTDSTGQVLSAEYPKSLVIKDASLPLALEVHASVLDSTINPDAAAVLQVSWCGKLHLLGRSAVPFSVSGVVAYENNVMGSK